jgi:hypothetical protein
MNVGFAELGFFPIILTGIQSVSGTNGKLLHLPGSANFGALIGVTNHHGKHGR